MTAIDTHGVTQQRLMSLLDIELSLLDPTNPDDTANLDLLAAVALFVTSAGYTVTDVEPTDDPSTPVALIVTDPDAPLPALRLSRQIVDGKLCVAAEVCLPTGNRARTFSALNGCVHSSGGRFRGLPDRVDRLHNVLRDARGLPQLAPPQG